jgi:hypothetical protein
VAVKKRFKKVRGHRIKKTVHSFHPLHKDPFAKTIANLAII